MVTPHSKPQGMGFGEEEEEEEDKISQITCFKSINAYSP
jgi:hypothetical protein